MNYEIICELLVQIYNTSIDKTLHLKLKKYENLCLLGFSSVIKVLNDYFITQFLTLITLKPIKLVT